MITGAIFDLDGTLLDSMFVWDIVGDIYLRSIGTEPQQSLKSRFETLSLYESAYLCKDIYGLRYSVDDIVCDFYSILKNYYEHDIQLKTGVAEFLQQLNENNVKMCIATASEENLARLALERCGIDKYFSKIITCNSLSCKKDQPIIYREALKHLGTEKNKTLVFEDALYALKTAKEDNFLTVAVYDKNEKNRGEMSTICDYYIFDYSTAREFWNFASHL